MLLLKSLQTTNAGEGVEKREPSSYTVVGNVNWYSHYRKQYRGSLKKMEIELSYDPAISLLSIHTEETRIERDTCTLMFITALFIIARTWKQPRCPSAEECRNEESCGTYTQWSITQPLKRIYLNQF